VEACGSGFRRRPGRPFESGVRPTSESSSSGRGSEKRGWKNGEQLAYEGKRRRSSRSTRKASSSTASGDDATAFNAQKKHGSWVRVDDERDDERGAFKFLKSRKAQTHFTPGRTTHHQDEEVDMLPVEVIVRTRRLVAQNARLRGGTPQKTRDVLQK